MTPGGASRLVAVTLMAALSVSLRLLPAPLVASEHRCQCPRSAGHHDCDCPRCAAAAAASRGGADDVPPCHRAQAAEDADRRARRVASTPCVSPGCHVPEAPGATAQGGLEPFLVPETAALAALTVQRAVPTEARQAPSSVPSPDPPVPRGA